MHVLGGVWQQPPAPRTGNRMQGRREAEWATGQFFDPGPYY